MINNKYITGIILAAGNSVRFNKGSNKNFELILNKPVIMYSVEVFENNDFIDNIIIVVKDNEKKYLNNLLKQFDIQKDILLVSGGSTRKESVYNALLKTEAHYVVIHDGARPNVNNKIINLCLENLLYYTGVITGVKSKDTIKIVNDNNVVVETTNRDNTWNIQTPQCFDKNILLEMHEKYKDDVTDDSLLLEEEYEVKVIEGDYANIKITTIEDIKIIEGFIKK